MERLLTENIVEDLDDLKPSKLGALLCPGCLKGKCQRKPFHDSSPSHRAATRLLHRVLFDYVGPFHIPSLGGSKYMLVVMDEKSRKGWGFYHQNRSQAPAELVKLFKQLQVETNLKIIELHSDGAQEFKDRLITDWCTENGTIQTFNTPHTSQHTLSERTHRTIVEWMRSNLYHATAPKILWAEAAAYALHIRNMVTVRRGVTSSPDMLWNPSHKPSVKKLRVWGCDAYVHIPDADRRKLDSKATLCIFLGMDTGDLYWRFFDVASYRFIRSRDATFDETSFTQCKALRQHLLHSTDSLAAAAAEPNNDEDYYDLLEDIRFKTELRAAERASAQEQPQLAASPLAARRSSCPIKRRGETTRTLSCFEFLSVGYPGALCHR